MIVNAENQNTKYEKSAELINRILRTIPRELKVLDNSLPIVSFGNPIYAKVLTISLNPSWREFLDNQKRWLDGDKRRVESLRSLGKVSPLELDERDVKQIIDRSHSYFEHQPYKQWFNQLNSVIQYAGGNYYDGTACHLDLVQWATTDVQKNLGDRWPKLVDDDANFLQWQLQQTSAPIVIMNGKSVVSQLIETNIVPGLDETEFVYKKLNGSRDSLKTYYAQSNGRIYFGWNKTLAYGISPELKESIFEQLRGLTHA